MLYYRRVVRHLVEVGDHLVTMVEEEAKAQQAAYPGTAPSEHVALVYERVTRTMRRSILLAQRLAERSKIRAHRIAARKKIIRDVEDAIQHKAPEHEQDALHAEFLERLDRLDLDEEIATRRIADIVTDITRDLGLAGLYDGHPWKRRIPHDVAILNARAEQPSGAAPSEKLTALLATAPPRRSAAIRDP